MLINLRGAVTVVPDAVIHAVQALVGRDAVSIHDNDAVSPFRRPFAEAAGR